MLSADGKLMKEKTKVVRDNNNFDKGDVNNIMVLNADGKVIENWSQWNSEVSIAHHIIIDPYDPAHAVWVVDRFNHRILKFSNDGKQLLLKVGEKGVPGNDENHFHDPASLAFLPDGSFYVADGYTNSRVVKFDKNGKYLMSWGSKGSGPRPVQPGPLRGGRRQPRLCGRSQQRSYPDLRSQRQVPRPVARHRARDPCHHDGR